MNEGENIEYRTRNDEHRKEEFLSEASFLVTLWG